MPGRRMRITSSITVRWMEKSVQWLKDFKAVKEGHVWCTTSNFYQESMSLGTFIMDVYKMLTEGEAADTAYMYLLK